MKKHFYALLAIVGLLCFNPNFATAAVRSLPTTENPADAQRKAAAAEQKAAAREKATAAKQVSKMKKLSVKSRRFTAKMERMVLVVLGLQESKTVTSPRQLRRQLHGHQKQLKTHAKFMSRIRRSHTHD
ncbi:hypothetical protein [Hymenobacter convexus]|uniref:hypothetical protein n=1 Tax=Hymenobacter sp. CA1UV-4 TaxID=3063782 RepID=UPI002712EECF|nr:hypothetical protein [Hymenobacter sp. CA1UV-4]MDO7852914.1 hypothetical protein [Hymenobacter sp. CA1UV-4]